MMGKNSDNGFSAVEILLVLVIVILIGVIGGLVYHNDHKTTVPQTASAKSSPTSSSTKPSTTSVIKIPQLGIEIVVPNALKGLIYAVSDQTSVNGEASIAVGFSTPALAAADPGCSAAHGPLGVIAKTDGQYPAGANDENSSGQLVKQYPNFYISYDPSQGECASPSNTNAINIANSSPRLSTPDITTVDGTTTVNGPPTLDFTVQLLQ
jgi:hypothetical protein